MNDKLMISKEEIEEAGRYWSSKMAEGVQELNLFGKVTSSNDSNKKEITVGLDKDICEQLRTLSKEQDLLTYIIIMTVIKITIYKYTGQKLITVASPIYSSNGEGYDYNMCIALNDCIKSNMSFKDLLFEVRKTIVDGYKNQFYPMEKLISEFGNDMSETLLFSFIVTYNKIHNKKHINELVYSQFNKITICFQEYGSDLNADIIFDSCCYEEEEVRQFWNRFQIVFRQVLKDRAIMIHEIELIDGNERNILLHDFNDTVKEYSQNSAIHQIFEKQAERWANKTAVKYDNISITYGDLNKKAERWAEVLKIHGVKAGTIVGIMAAYSLELVIGILAVLKAGGAYLPIDPEYPAERIKYMLSNSKTRLLMTCRNLVQLHKEVVNSDIIILKLEEEPSESKENDKIETVVRPKDLAYIIYTSGSTGRPKAVMIEHSGVVNLTEFRIKQYGYNEQDRILQLLSVSFDGFGTNLYSALLSGATLVLPVDSQRMDFNYINNLIYTEKITSMSIVPAMYDVIVHNAKEWQLKSLKYVILAGQKTKPNIIKYSKEHLPDTVLVNEYGPTENTITTTIFIGMLENLPNIIGKPISNVKVYVLDCDRKLVPIGVPGELCVSGVGLARGYFENNEMTELKFIPNPFNNKEKMYCTGDLVRWCADHTIEFLHRIDEQVKVNGYRIELEEVEQVILEHEYIKNTIVAVLENENSDQYLCAYLVTEQENAAAELRASLEKVLPANMIPSRFIIVSELPLTSNGKVDRRTFINFHEQTFSKEKCMIPQTDMEQKIADIWKEVLNQKQIDINESFFHIGGNSILLMKVYAMLDKVYPEKFDIPTLFLYPTIAKLSQYLQTLNVTDELQDCQGILFPENYRSSNSQTEQPDGYYFEISNELYAVLNQICVKEKIDIHDILLAVFICLLARISKQKQIAVHTNITAQDNIVMVEANVGELDDLKELVKIVAKQRSLVAANVYQVDFLNKRKIGLRKEIIYPFYFIKSGLSKFNPETIYDLIIEADRKADRICLRCDYNHFKLNPDRIEGLADMYVKLATFFVSQW